MALGRIMHPSTWRLLKEGGWIGFIKLRTLHGYVYLKWIKQYVRFAIKTVIPRLGPGLKRYVVNRYHCKVLTGEEALAVITVDKPIDLHNVPEQMIPFPYVRDIVIKWPHDIAIMECACRAAQGGSCHPSKVCMVIGQPFVDFVVEHQPDAERITPDEALEILEREHRNGRIHAAWFKDACIGRFYAICSCCACCCSGNKAMRLYNAPIVAPSGYAPRLHSEECRGCGACEAVCHYDAIKVVDGKSVHDFDACLGCGLCESRCDNSAITLELEPRQGLPLDVRVLAAEQERMKQGGKS